ncbi:sensor histidine kinase [Gemella cuniculi]|uniref:sensor histidine kinase n=1 Tax=Gemella cuniculi TaxID=150240 RepID=UPI0004106EF8|nr:histidine kinase [Gemella cuniculi]
MINLLRIDFKKNYPFYLSLVFFVFPFVYTIQGDYPKYILLLTILAIISYLAILHTNNKYLIFIQWFYLVFYIVYMTTTLFPMNMLFSFYLSNLLVWRFHDKYNSYRTISFFIAINYMMIYIAILGISIGDKLIMFCFYFICLATYLFQKRGYEKSILKEERNKHNEHINILLAENERNRISRDLHDSIGHVFVMLKLKAELAEKFLEKNNIDAAKKELLEISAISKKSMDDTRAIINKLKHRTIKEELNIIKDIMAMANIDCKIKNNIDTSVTQLNEWSITMLLKEFANNIIKHSKSTQCSIILNEDTHKYEIISVDNGVGFENLTGNELKSIRERIKVLNGKVEIISKKSPTTVQATILKSL